MTYRESYAYGCEILEKAQIADAKLDEVVLIYSKATSQEKQDGYKKLSNLYPALTTRMESLKK